MKHSALVLLVLVLVMLGGMVAARGQSQSQGKPSAPTASVAQPTQPTQPAKPAPPAQPAANPSQHVVSELTRSHIDLAYQKALNAQKDAQAAIQAFNQAIQQGIVDEELGAGWTIRFDPQSEQATVVPVLGSSNSSNSQPARGKEKK